MAGDPHDFDGEVKRNFRWNFLVSMSDLSLYGFGMSFVTAATILPAFLRYLTTSSLIIGLLPSVGLLASTLPQIFVAKRMERLSVKKPLAVIFGFGERIYWLLLAIATLFLYQSPALCLAAFFIIYAAGNLSMGAATTPWWDMITKIMGERRGLFYGLSSLVGGIFGVLGALFSRQLLGQYAYPHSFVFSFALAFTLTFVSWIFLTLTREPPYPVLKEQDSLRGYLWKLPDVFKRDRNFTLFTVATLLTSFAGMASPFYTVYSIDRLNLTDSDIAVFTVLLLGSRMLVSPVMGYLGDRVGHKLFLELGVVGSISAALVGTYANSIVLFYLIFIFMGCSISAEMVSQMSIVPEFCTPEGRPVYLGLINTIRAPFMALPPALGGLLASALGYPQVFLLTSLILALGLGFLHLVKEPNRKKPNASSQVSNIS